VEGDVGGREAHHAADGHLGRGRRREREHDEQEEPGPGSPRIAIGTGRSGGAPITGQLFFERWSWDDL